MPPHARALLGHLRRLAAPADSDAALLARWLERRDEAAFAALVARHGPMVLSVCRRVLGDEHTAEDAFQATFLVLARKASALRRPEALPSFLFGVALRLARKSRGSLRRRMVQIHPDVPEPADPHPHPLDALTGRELLALLDEEVARLPEVYRLPLLLCVMQGRSVEEAARLLDWSHGSLRGRLARGREKLRERLARRGLALSVGALTLLAPAAVPEHLRAAALRNLAAPAAPAVGALAAPGLKLQAICFALFVAIAAGLGASLSLLPGPNVETPAAAPPAAPPAQAKDEPRVDRFDDPLPPGAIARQWTKRFSLNTHREDQVAFAPDGKTLVAAWHGGMTFFDAANGKQRKNIKPIGTGVSRLAYSPDGKRLLVYAQIPTHSDPEKAAVQTWDVDTERKIAETELQHICWLGWSAKGQPRAATLGNGEIIYHELETGRKQRLPAKDLFAPQLVSLCRCVAADNLLVAGGAKGAIHIWDVTSGKERFMLHPGVYVISLALSADGGRLASASRDAANKNPVQLWDTTTGKLMRSLETGNEVLFAPDGKTLVVSRRADMRFWDAATAQQLSRIRSESSGFGPAVAFSPDSKTLATTESNGGAIQLWDVAGGKLKPQPQGHTYPPSGISFSPDGNRVATCTFQDGTIRIWNVASGEPLFRIRHPGWPRNAIFSPDGRTLYSCWTGDKVYFDDTADGRERFVLTVQDAERPKLKPDGLGLHLSDDGLRLTTFHTGDDKFLEMLVTGWDTGSRKQLYQRRRVHDVFWNALSPDGRTVAAAHAGSPDVPYGRLMGKGPVYLEDLAGGDKLLTFPNLAGQTVPLTFSPDGHLLVSYNDVWHSGHEEQTLRLWEVLTATELRAFPISSFDKKAAFSADGRLLALTTPVGELLVWDVRRAREHRRFRGLGAHVTALTFSPDNRRLISGLSDSTLLVWDIPPCDNPRGERAVEEVARAWDDLGATNAPRAFRARWALVSAPEETIALLKEHLHPARPADPKRLCQLLGDLESEQFAVREKAQAALAELGDLAAPALRQTLADKPTLEVRRRVQALLDRLSGPVTRPKMLLSLRAVAVLEDIGTPEARQLLEELAKGADGARLTREAKASLKRLEQRTARD